MAKFGAPKLPNNQPGKAKKPANQGGSAKVNVQQPKNTGMPKAAKPGATVTMFSKAPKGTRGK